MAADRSAALPVIDVAPLVAGGAPAEVARQIERACREHGFFYVTGHGVAPGDYLLGKVSKVFPQLRREVLTGDT